MENPEKYTIKFNDLNRKQCSEERTSHTAKLSAIK